MTKPHRAFRTGATKEQIIETIQKVARELGRAPTREELDQLGGISPALVRKHFVRHKSAMRAAGMEPLPSVGNFLTVDAGDGRALARALEREGVIVRPLEPFGAPESIRIMVGTPEDNAAFAAALGRALQPR